MGVFATIARVFGGAKPTQGSGASETVVVRWNDRPAAPAQPRDRVGTLGNNPAAPARSGMPPVEPVRIDLTPAERPAPPAPAPAIPGVPATELVKAEEVREILKDELRDSYERAISLAEKVDRHLDTQEMRSRRLLEIAESLPAALESLGTIGEGQAELRSAVSELASAFREGHASTQKGLSLQLESLGRVEGLIAEANDSQREIRASIENLSSAFSEITASNQRLGEALTDMKRRDSEREDRLRVANERTHKLLVNLLIGGGVIGGLAVLALVAQAVIALAAA
jgi:hypothetical protein